MATTRSELVQRVDTGNAERPGSISNTSNQTIPPNTNLAFSTDGSRSQASLHEQGTDKAASKLDISNESEDIAGFLPNISDNECEPDVLDVAVNSSSMEEEMNEESCCTPECGIPEDAGSAREMSAPKFSGSACSDLSVAVVAEKDSMCDNIDGVHDSEKCLEMSSGFTTQTQLQRASTQSSLILQGVSQDISQLNHMIKYHQLLKKMECAYFLKLWTIFPARNML